MATENNQSITTDRVIEMFPLLMLLFKTTFSELAKIPLKESDKKELMFESFTLYEAMKGISQNLPDNYDKLNKIEQEAAYLRTASYVFLSGMAGALVEAVKQIPIDESADGDKVH